MVKDFPNICGNALTPFFSVSFSCDAYKWEQLQLCMENTQVGTAILTEFALLAMSNFERG